jgi:hypothetical protein
MTCLETGGLDALPSVLDEINISIDDLLQLAVLTINRERGDGLQSIDVLRLTKPKHT